MMKKLVSIILGFFLLLNFSGQLLAQDCSTACKIPESVDCLRCTNKQNNPSGVTQECLFACKNPASFQCRQCRGEDLEGVDLGGSVGANSDPTGDCGENGIDTAIGCINVLGSQEEFLGQLLGWAIGVGGGIAFLLIVYASFMVMTSGGNPDRLKAGQELLTSAISGIVLLVLSIFVLKFIGVDILGLDRFGFGQ